MRIILRLALLCVAQWSYGSSCEERWSDFDPRTELDELIELEQRIDIVNGRDHLSRGQLTEALTESYDDSILFKVLRFDGLLASYYGLTIEPESHSFLITCLGFSADLSKTARSKAQQMIRADMIRELQAKKLETIVAGVVETDTTSRKDLRSLGFVKVGSYKQKNEKKLIYTLSH